MRNLKKLLAVIVAVCVLTTFTVSALAQTKTDAQISADLGIILGSGSGVTAEYLATQPDRLQGAIMFLRLKGLEAAAKAFIGTDNFADVDALSDTNQAILAYLKANPDLGFGGIGDNKFAPLVKMTAKEYYKVLLVALGFTYGTDARADFTWKNVLSFAVSKGLSKLVDNEAFTVNDLCIGTVEALKASVKGGTKSLITTLVENNSVTAAKAAASGLFVAAPPAAPAVVSATADTLKTAKVVFNQDVDSATVSKTNISNSDVDSVSLLGDKRTVVVVFTTTKTQSAKADIVIENVKSVSGVKIAKTTRTVEFVDTTIPAITGAIAKNAKTIEIQVSEPIANAGFAYTSILSDIKIDGTAAIAWTAVDNVKNTITLNLFSLMTAGVHKIDISGLKDYAGYTAVAQTFNFDVAADAAAPVMTAAKINNLKEVEVTFSEDINAAGSFWINGDSVTATQQSNKAIFRLAMPTGKELDISAIVEVKVEYQDQTDVVGNKVATKTTYVLKQADDTALPTVSAAIGTDNKITLTFSKTMYSAGAIRVLKASDNSLLGTAVTVVDGTFKADTNKTVIEIAAATSGLNDNAGLDIKVNIKDMKDGTIRKNALAEQNLTLKANDTLRPTVTTSYTAVAATDSANDTATFYFSEAMDAITLGNLGNYIMTSGGAIESLSSFGASVKEIAADAKSITITIKGVAASTSTFMIYALKDAAGNVQNAVTTQIAKLPPSSTFEVITVTATATDKIEVVFNGAVKSFGPNAFVVRETGIATTGAGYAFIIGIAVDNAKVTLTLNKGLGTDASVYRLDLNDASAAKNLFGTALAATPVSWAPIADKVAPTATVAAATSGSILVTLSEDVTVTSSAILLNDLIVRKADGSIVTSVTEAAITYLSSADVVVTDPLLGFRKIQISGLAATTEYTVELLPRAIKDKFALNTVAALARTSVTTK